MRMNNFSFGDLIIVGFHGTVFNNEIRELLDDLRPAGVILFTRNIVATAQVLRLNRSLQNYSLERLNRGLFIGVDQEGGRVARLSDPFTPILPALALAESQTPHVLVRNSVVTMAGELRAVGFNLDFAPVLDVLSHADDLSTTVIGDRSYGADPQIVSELGIIAIRSLRENGVIPCGKHFPGHGGTLVDSHKALPVDNRSIEEIDRHDLPPFATAIQHNIEMLMTAHVLYPNWDPGNVATVSHTILKDLLRHRMQFKGIVITDDLDMAAISAGNSIEDISIKALKAGADLLLFCNDPQKAFHARDAVVNAAQSGELSATELNKSLDRIATLKAQYASSFGPPIEPPPSLRLALKFDED